jgi:hypothetical protein
MDFRRWVSWLAVAAILLHAGTVARHNVIRFEAIPNELAQLAGFDAGVVCHTDSETGDNGTAQGLSGKDPASTSKPCPVCLGLASAHALTASNTPALRVPRAVFIARLAPQEREAAPAVRLSLPPTRGPPSIA